MAKDPRFNFYPDNWDGGTEDFTLEQEGAYLRLIIMQSRKGRFTSTQAVDCLMRKTRGDAAACAGLWNFLMPKFATDGQLFWSERLEKEVAKSRHHSEEQAKRAEKRWKKPHDAAALPDSMPDNSKPQAFPEMEVVLEVEEKKENVSEEFDDDRQLEQWTRDAINHNDHLLEVMEQQDAKKTGVPWPPWFQRTKSLLDHQDLAKRYKWKFNSQQEFRHSALKVMRDNKNVKPNGTLITATGSKKQQQVSSLVEGYHRRHSEAPAGGETQAVQ